VLQLQQQSQQLLSQHQAALTTPVPRLHCPRDVCPTTHSSWRWLDHDRRRRGRRACRRT
jgi:hypothetical protein